MKLQLRDRKPELVEAWAREFKGVADVEISCGDILDVRADAVVSPANSFGFMDGGIDLAYSQRFGWDVQERLQELLRAEHHGELPVGSALIVETYAEEVAWLVSAPTMRVPCDVSGSVHAYLALRAALIPVRAHNAGGSPGTRARVGRRCVRRTSDQVERRVRRGGPTDPSAQVSERP